MCSSDLYIEEAKQLGIVVGLVYYAPRMPDFSQAGGYCLACAEKSVVAAAYLVVSKVDPKLASCPVCNRVFTIDDYYNELLKNYQHEADFAVWIDDPFKLANFAESLVEELMRHGG